MPTLNLVPGDDRLPLAAGVNLDPGEVTWRFSTAGGPGGQHVNTSNTRAEATFDIAASPTLPEWARARLVTALGPVVTVAAGDTRSQTRNRELALGRLADRLRQALVVRPSRQATKPTKASQRRRLDQKKRRAQVKNDRRRLSSPDD